MPGLELVPYLLAIALYAPAGGFLAVGHWYLGNMKDVKEIGVLTFFIGIIQMMTIIFLSWLGAGFEAMTVIPLAFTWLVLGTTAILGLPSFKPLADMLITLVIAYVCEAFYFWVVAGAITFGIMVMSYAIVVTLIILNTYGKLGPKPVGYLLIVEGIITVLFPALASWFGILLP